jgi:hypothetical protein
VSLFRLAREVMSEVQNFIISPILHNALVR